MQSRNKRRLQVFAKSDHRDTFGTRRLGVDIDFRLFCDSGGTSDVEELKFILVFLIIYITEAISYVQPEMIANILSLHL